MSELKEEIWLNSTIFPEKYSISNYGRLKNKTTGGYIWKSEVMLNVGNRNFR